MEQFGTKNIQIRWCTLAEVLSIGTRIFRHSQLSVSNSFGQKVKETAPLGKGSRSDLPSELSFALAPRETDPTPEVTRSSRQIYFP